MTSDRPEQVLEGYFEDLLGSSEEPKSESINPTPQQPQLQAETLVQEEQVGVEPDPQEDRQQVVAKLLAQAQQALIDHENAQALVIDPSTPVLEEPSVKLKSESVLQDELSWAENGRPQWAQSRFDVLLFEVSGLTLAVPLIALGKILPLGPELTTIKGQANWFMGLQPSTNGKIQVVNTALFVMPERYDKEFANSAELIVTINGVPWGLAVNGVNQPISLEPEDVKWRTERSKRAWLAGTVKNHMCALIDIPMMADQLNRADKKNNKKS